MARFHPAAKLLLHDVAIYASVSVIGHVGIATRVYEGVGADAYCHTDGDAQDDPVRHMYFLHVRSPNFLPRQTVSFVWDDIPHTGTSKCHQGLAGAGTVHLACDSYRIFDSLSRRGQPDAETHRFG